MSKYMLEDKDSHHDMIHREYRRLENYSLYVCSMITHTML